MHTQTPVPFFSAAETQATATSEDEGRARALILQLQLADERHAAEAKRMHRIIANLQSEVGSLEERCLELTLALEEAKRSVSSQSEELPSGNKAMKHVDPHLLSPPVQHAHDTQRQIESTQNIEDIVVDGGATSLALEQRKFQHEVRRLEKSLCEWEQQLQLREVAVARAEKEAAALLAAEVAAAREEKENARKAQDRAIAQQAAVKQLETSLAAALRTIHAQNYSRRATGENSPEDGSRIRSPSVGRMSNSVTSNGTTSLESQQKTLEDECERYDKEIQILYGKKMAADARRRFIAQQVKAKVVLSQGSKR